MWAGKKWFNGILSMIRKQGLCKVIASVKPESMADLFNEVMSFDTFMEQYAYSLQGLRKDLMKMVYER